MNEKTFALMVSSKGQEWYTPLEVYQKLDAEFHFTTDPCAEPTNRLGCQIFYTKDQDGLKQVWTGNVFINPPYGRAGNVNAWIERAAAYGKMGYGVAVMLIPARTDTRWFHNYIWGQPGVEIRFIQGRLKFENPDHVSNTAPFPSMVVIFRKPE